MNLKIEYSQALKQKPGTDEVLGFGQHFTDHMFMMDYHADQGWYNARIVPYQPLALDPATTVLHYGQSIFEGLKAYLGPNGETLLFRPRDNFIRMNQSAQRMCMPTLDVDDVMEALGKLLSIEAGWIPNAKGTSLYIRPTMIATDPFLGVHAAKQYLFYIILSPVGAYYASGLNPVSIYVEDEYVRAVRGGTGFAKTAANYAISLLAGELAQQKGFSQVLWLDGIERKYIEEVGAMNIFFKIKGELITAPLEGSILGGITRNSVIRIAGSMGMPVSERRLAIHEVFDAARQGSLEEVFGTGTAAVISPVGQLCWKGETLSINQGKIGALSQTLYDTLTLIQYGRKQDTFGWVVKV